MSCLGGSLCIPELAGLGTLKGTALLKSNHCLSFEGDEVIGAYLEAVCYCGLRCEPLQHAGAAGWLVIYQHLLQQRR